MKINVIPADPLFVYNFDSDASSPTNEIARKVNRRSVFYCAVVTKLVNLTRWELFDKQTSKEPSLGERNSKRKKFTSESKKKNKNSRIDFHIFS